MRAIQVLGLCSALALWLGCGGGEGAGLDPPSLRVHTTTTGVELDPDGYTLALDGNARQPIAANAALEIASLADGPHTVELLGVAPNCEVQGSHPRTVETSPGGTADVEFDVECGPTIGSVRVITRTSGPDRDEDGYVVLVNGEARPIAVNESITYEEVSAGPAVIEIVEVAANCPATTQTYYEPRVIGGETIEVNFAFECAARQPDTGTLQVATATSGPSPDADGYSVSVDGGPGRVVASSGTVLLTDLPIGARSVALSGIAANCAVSGENPRAVTVTGTELAVAAFDIVCTEPPAATGILSLTTATTGTEFAPTGYAVRVDETGSQPVGVNATVSITGLASGSHSIALEDVTPNCTVGDNPRTISITAGAETAVTFAVSCTPAFGFITTVTQTTGTGIDPDGYVVRVDGGAGTPVAVNETVTRGGLPPGNHTVQLDNVASNCQVQGDNPRTVLVAGNESTTVAFEVLCAATTGTMAITVSGLPGGAAAGIEVTGPNDFVATLNGTGTLEGLGAGEYAVTAEAVTVNGVVYQPTAPRQEATIVPGESVTVNVSYSSTPGSAINLRIGGMYLTQGSQTPESGVPLVEGRDGFLRVFVLASGASDARPAVRIRMFQDGAPTQTVQIGAPAATVPTLIQEQDLGASWNLRIPGARIQRGLAILAEVDPGATVPESDETDNAFPLDGNPVPLTVRTAPVFAVTLVPVRLGTGGLTGDVTSTNAGRYLNAAVNLHPLSQVDAVLHPIFTSSLSPAQSGGVNPALSNALAELSMLRAVEGSARSYYGVTHRSYSSGGIAGIAYLGQPVGLGWDDPSGAGNTAAHEFGHNWNRRHAPCGGPSNVDPAFPYVGAIIGQYGFDLANEFLIDPSTHDLMSYCHPRWVSDYTYVGVLTYRESLQASLRTQSNAEAARQTCLVVWGRIENGRPVLEPSFLVHTRPSIPTEPGPYRLEALTRSGGQAFSVSFQATRVADGPEGAEHFAFAIPIDSSAAAELSAVRLAGAAGSTEVSAVAAEAQAAQPLRVQRTGVGVRLQWDGASARMAMVRDASTGEVLALGRGASVELPARASRLVLDLSDGIRSRRVEVEP